MSEKPRPVIAESIGHIKALEITLLSLIRLIGNDNLRYQLDEAITREIGRHGFHSLESIESFDAHLVRILEEIKEDNS